MVYKKVLQRITIVFLGILIFLTFFSRTLLDLQIPRVSVDFIKQGSINPTAVSSGIVTHADTERIFSHVSGRIIQIMQKGENTDDHWVLFTIISDTQALKALMDQLEQAGHELQMNALAIEQTGYDLQANAISIEQTELNLINAEGRLAFLLEQPLDLPIPPVLDLLEFDIQLNANTASIESAKSELEKLKILYAGGAVPRQDVVNKEAELNRLSRTRDEIIARQNMAVLNYGEAVERHEKLTASSIQNREEQIQSQQNIITGYNFALSNQKTERSRIESRLAGQYIERGRIESRLLKINEQIAAGGVTVVPSNSFPNRIITEIAPGLDLGSMVAEYTPVMTTAILNNRFIIKAPFPQIQDFIQPNQDADILIGARRMEGKTIRVIPDGGTNLVYIELYSSQLHGGELAQVTISGGNFNYPNIIPLSALREERDEYYILYVVPYERRFGSSHDYIVYRMQVDVIQTDDRNAAILGRFGMDLPNGPVIINSDMPISATQRVRLVPGHDFAPTR